MELQTPNSRPFQHKNASADPGLSRDTQRIFEVLQVGLDELDVGAAWRSRDTSALKEVLSDQRLSGAVIEETLSRGSWRLISEVLQPELSASCLPSRLLSSEDFTTRISAIGRVLSDDEVAKISLWRSVLVANPWRGEVLDAREYEAWRDLSFKVYEALSRSSIDENYGSDPGQLVHVVDVVNLASRNIGPQRQPTRITVQEAFQGLVDCLSQAQRGFSFDQGPLSELDLYQYKRDPGFRTALTEGALKSESKEVAHAFLIAIAAQPGLSTEWAFRVSMAEKAIEISSRPLAVCFSLLEQSTDPAVLSAVMRNISNRLEFPLSKRSREEVASLNSRGGEILGGLLLGLDASHARSGWFDTYPLLVQRFVQACAVARVPHGMSSDRLESLSQSRGGPLSAEQLWVALSALDPVSIEGVGTKLRALIRR